MSFAFTCRVLALGRARFAFTDDDAVVALGFLVNPEKVEVLLIAAASAQEVRRLHSGVECSLVVIVANLCYFALIDRLSDAAGRNASVKAVRKSGLLARRRLQELATRREASFPKPLVAVSPADPQSSRIKLNAVSRRR